MIWMLTGVSRVHGKCELIGGHRRPVYPTALVACTRRCHYTHTDASLNVSIIICDAQGEPSLFPQSPVGAKVSIGSCKSAGGVIPRSLTRVHLGSPDVSG